MILTNKELISQNGSPIRYLNWHAQSPKAVLIVLHGMAEHAGRYAPLAEALCPLGFEVYAPEYPGHGEGAGKLGFFAPKDGFELVCEDMIRFYRFIHKTHPDLPILLFGHSMGTIFARALMMQDLSPAPKGCLLSGVTVDQPIRRDLAPAMIKLIGTLSGGMDKVSPIVMGMSIGAFSKAVQNAKTPCDWLSRDENAVNAYISDPLCGFNLTSSMMHDVARGILWTLKPENEKRIPDKMPVRICVGACDPVGGEKAANELKRRWVRLGKNISVSVYPQARHELLNELCRESFLKEVQDFFLACLTQAKNT